MSLNNKDPACAGNDDCDDDTPADALPSKRILNLVSVSTSMAIVSFLCKHLDSWFVSTLDACLYSILFIVVSELFETDNALLPLSRRLSLLVLVEKIRPFTRVASGTAALHIESMMSNALIVVATALVPARIAESEDGAVLLTAVQYMYADSMDFAAEWHDIRLSVLLVAIVALHVFNNGMIGADGEAARHYRSSKIWSTLCAIGSMVCISLILKILLGIVRSVTFHADAYALHLALIITVVHAAAFFVMDVAGPTSDYMQFNMASEFSNSMIASTQQQSSAAMGWWWIHAAAVFIVFGMLRWWPGPNMWATQCAMLVFVNLVVFAALQYIKRLAVSDAFITLKTSALVLQFVMHQLVGVLH
jgi:hypothetical protein